MLTGLNFKKLKSGISVPSWFAKVNSSRKEETSLSVSDSDEEEVEHVVPKDLDELVNLIKLELGEYGLTSDKVNVKKIMALMRNYKANDEDYKKYAHFDKNKYTRNLVDSGNGEFNLLVLAWGEGHQSPIHDHSGSHCIMKILDGKLQEDLFEWPKSEEKGSKMKNYKTTVYNRDEVTYMADNLGLHQVSSFGKPSLSLHLYTPPIKVCSTFVEKSGEARKCSPCTFYSVKGEKIEHCK